MDKQNKGDGIKIVISFILILALGVSMFAIIKSGDKLLSNLDSYLGITTAPGTTVDPGTSGNSGTTATPQQTTAAKTYSTSVDSLGAVEFLPVEYFYKTIDNVTYFYAAYEWASATSYDDYEGPSCVWYGAADYGTYSGVIRFSYDLQSFNLPSDMSGTVIPGDDGGHYQYSFRNLEAKGGKLYISYCSITNCSDPNGVLSDLIENVFNNKTYFSVIVTSSVGDEPGELPS